MSMSPLPWWFRQSAVFGYGIAVLSAAAAVIAGRLVNGYTETAPFVSLFFCAIMFAAWVGGAGPGLFATALSVLAFDHYFVAPINSFAVAPNETPRIVLFAIAGLFVVLLTASQRSAAESFRRARDDLERAGKKLEDVNRALQIESAQRKRSEAYLTEAQRLTRTGSFAWNISSRNLAWSEETYRILGIDPTVEPTIDVILQSIHPDGREVVQHKIERAIQVEQDYDHEHRLLMANGSSKSLHVRAHRVNPGPGEEEIVGAIVDVTETRKAQEALHVAQAELAHVTRLTTLGEVTASIAHEVNQPLAAIVTNGEVCLRLLDHEMPNLSEVRETIGAVISSGRRASDIIRQVRDFSKKTNPEMSRLDISSVIDEAVALLRSEALNHRVTKRLELAPGLHFVHGDRIQLQQVIINLLINAIQAMATVTDRARVVLIRTQQHGADQVLVAIEDTGIGIEPENLSRLFSAFYTTKPDGMGMGLSICRSIIEAHAGRVWASRNAGPGMTFQFTIPAWQGG
jgi:PAS domain S-box-containing protein